ncbi:hypothetical protein [Wenzhouxiangella sp. EGI_FJ10409]|uniref:hypothetical protein n=1 Tax=Wenzhouxiangella sp. EGI_FJ10409 TaxID=3243767 RepID=UPI0035D8B57D
MFEADIVPTARSTVPTRNRFEITILERIAGKAAKPAMPGADKLRGAQADQ